jgi:hypothetical protein
MKLYAINKELLQESLQQALRHWQKSEIPDVKPITQLRLFKRLIAQEEHSTPKTAVIVRQLIELALKVLQDRNEDAAYLLRERYLNDTGIKQLARHFVISESQFYKLQSEAVTLLAEIILEQEQQAQYERQVTIEARLEALANQQLFGVINFNKNYKR